MFHVQTATGPAAGAYIVTSVHMTAVPVLMMIQAVLFMAEMYDNICFVVAVVVDVVCLFVFSNSFYSMIVSVKSCSKDLIA